MKAKRIVSGISVLVILIAVAWVLIYTYKEIPITYDGSDTDVYEIMQDPDNVDLSDPDGIADIIVKENLSKTNAMNDVASIVFDFRGFDTLGESFILLTAIAGSFVILSVKKKNKKEEDK